MNNSLYDLLEVSQIASGEAIAANFKRLHDAYSALAANGDEAALHRMIAIKEAFTTLSDPTRRQRYDDKLAAQMVIAEESPAISSSNKWLLLLIALGIGIFASQKYFAYKEHQEQLRLQAEQAAADIQQAELEAQRERDERLAAAREEQRQRNAEALERMEQERAIAYGQQVTRDLERAKEIERQQLARSNNQEAQAQRQRQSDTQRQLAREREFLRQRDAENRRNYNGVGAGGIAPGTPNPNTCHLRI